MNGRIREIECQISILNRMCQVLPNFQGGGL